MTYRLILFLTFLSPIPTVHPQSVEDIQSALAKKLANQKPPAFPAPRLPISRHSEDTGVLCSNLSTAAADALTAARLLSDKVDSLLGTF